MNAFVELDTAFAKILDGQLRAVHTAMPGQVVSFDRALQTVSVQPVLQRLYADADEPENLPIIEDVPVVFPGSGDFWFLFDVKPGSFVLLIFAERSIAKWLESGGVVDPELNQKMDLSDAIAIPGINPFPGAVPAGAPPDAMALTNRAGTTYLKIENGKLVLNANLVELAEAGATDFAVAFTDMKAAFDQLKADLNSFINTIFNLHTHPAPGGATGVPATLGTSSTADMSGAKVDKVKVP